MELLRICAALLTFIPALAIPPEDFGFPSAPNDTMLSVTFPGHVEIREAELLGINVPAQQPQLAVDPTKYKSIANYKGTYLVIMVDPDASTPQNPTERWYLHWLQPSLTSDAAGTLTNTSAPFVPYARPAPPSTSDAHRYILYAFEQPQNFAIPPAFSGFNANNRGKFRLDEFINQADLGKPAAANYFFVTNKTGVPATFTAPAGSSYPGGNGGAITDGPGPTSLSSGVSSAMSTAMSSGTASGTASATAGSSSSTGSATSAAATSARATGAAGKVDVAGGLNVAAAAAAAVGAYVFGAL